MAVLSPPFLLGSSGQVMSARLARLSLGAAWRPAATGVQVVSGVLAGPANTQGELALPAPTQLTVQPYRAVVQSAIDATAGSYEVINDAQVTLAVTAQHASQFRRALVVIRVDDAQVSGVASTATTDRAVLEILDGALAASSGATVLPTPAGSWLALGEVLIPPTGQTVTLTPYNPRTGLRHGILPVIADGATVTGHDGYAGTQTGQYRDLPNRGLQRWSGTAWGDPHIPEATAYPGIGGQSQPAGFAAPRFLRDASGFVRGTGLLLDANARAANATISGNLPAAFRPTTVLAGLIILGTTSTGVPTMYRWNVNLDGTITSVGGAAASTYYFLDSLNYQVNN